MKYDLLDYLLSSDMFSVGGDTVMTAPWMVVLFVLTLHLHHTKYLLVNVDSSNKPVSRNSNKPISRNGNKPISKNNNKPVSNNSNKTVSRNSNKAVDWAYLTEDDSMSMLGGYVAIIIKSIFFCSSCTWLWNYWTLRLTWNLQRKVFICQVLPGVWWWHHCRCGGGVWGLQLWWWWSRTRSNISSSKFDNHSLKDQASIVVRVAVLVYLQYNM